MQLENSFEVPAPPPTTWALLLDIPRVVPCMPGAELTETVDESNWKARMGVKLGPISLTFGADVRLEEVDEAARRVRFSADARELRGRGAARATIESTMTPAGSGTRVDIVTDVAMSGLVAQYGRGMIADVSAQLIERFADCLRSQLEASPQDAEAAIGRQSKPVSGLMLGLSAFMRAYGAPFWASVFGIYMLLGLLAVGTDTISSFIVAAVTAALVYLYVGLYGEGAARRASPPRSRRASRFGAP